MKLKQLSEEHKPRIFLGGTCNDSTWRDQLIQHLDKAGIDYFNPVVDDWNEEAQKEEIRQRKTCDFVLYTITPQMTGVYSIAEAVDDSNKRPQKTIFLPLQEYDGDSFDDHQWKSLQQVAEMIKENGGTVCNSLEDVVNCL